MSYIHFIGIDVSKEWVDVALHDAGVKPQRFASDSKGFAALAKHFAAELPEALVVLESTGGYETALIAFLLANCVSVHRADPRATSYFIRSLGKRAKTDQLDALALARYGAERHARLRLCRISETGQEALQALLARRADLIAMRVAEQNRRQHPRYDRHAFLKRSLNAVRDVLIAELVDLESQITALIEQAPALAAKFAVMTSVKGIGKQTAFTLLACMPELGTLTRRQAASLAGCAPHPKDSGKTQGYRATRGGRGSVKRSLFMAAMAARRFNLDLRLFYERLIGNGKKPIVAITAIMRKLIVILNAKLRDYAHA